MYFVILLKYDTKYERSGIMKTIDMSKLNKKVKAITELNNKTIAKELLLSAYNNEWETTRKTLEICLT